MIDLNNKVFKVISNSENGEVATDLRFHYKQVGNILTCDYKGKKIKQGHLIGIVSDDDTIELSYHQINIYGKLKAGLCHSKINQLSNGKIRIYEQWQWTSGDKSKGTSILEEV